MRKRTGMTIMGYCSGLQDFFNQPIHNNKHDDGSETPKLGILGGKKSSEKSDDVFHSFIF